MKNYLFTLLMIADLFLITTTNSLANCDSSLAEKKNDLFSYDEEGESTIFAVYKLFADELGGNEIRTENDGSPCQGWVKDYYENGTLLHKGYYVDGRLKIYKNYYENGTIARSLELKGHRNANLKIFYPDGKPKTVCNYFRGNLRKCTKFEYDNNIDVEIYVIKN